MRTPKETAAFLVANARSNGAKGAEAFDKAEDIAWGNHCSNLHPGFGHGEPNHIASDYWRAVRRIIRGNRRKEGGEDGN